MDFEDCLARCTGKEMCDSNKVIDNHASAKCAKLFVTNLMPTEQMDNMVVVNAFMGSYLES